MKSEGKSKLAIFTVTFGPNSYPDQKLRQGFSSSLLGWFRSHPPPSCTREVRTSRLWAVVTPVNDVGLLCSLRATSFLTPDPRQLGKAIKSENLTFDQCIPASRRSGCPYIISIIRLTLEFGPLHCVERKKSIVLNHHLTISEGSGGMKTL